MYVSVPKTTTKSLILHMKSAESICASQENMYFYVKYEPVAMYPGIGHRL